MVEFDPASRVRLLYTVRENLVGRRLAILLTLTFIIE
jgi:hypothetical protein